MPGRPAPRNPRRIGHFAFPSGTRLPLARRLLCSKLEGMLTVDSAVLDRRATGRILLVEDDRNSREGLRELLVAAGHYVETAADGWEAVGRIKLASYELAIIDVDLPAVLGITVDGWDLVRIFRAFHPQIAIVLVSACGGDEVERLAHQLQVSTFLEKPLRPSRLRTEVARLLLPASASSPSTD